MRTTQRREVDLIKSEKRKRGDWDPWQVPLNSHLLRIFLKPPPASFTIVIPPFQPYLLSVLAIRHLLKHPIPTVVHCRDWTPCPAASLRKHSGTLFRNRACLHACLIFECVFRAPEISRLQQILCWLLCSWQAADAAAIPACPMYNLPSLCATGRHYGTRSTILIDFLGGQEGKSMTLFLISKAYKHSEK